MPQIPNIALIDDNLGTGNTEVEPDEGFAAFISTAVDLGVPVAENKSVQSGTAVVYVGFKRDTIRRLAKSLCFGTWPGRNSSSPRGVVY